MFEATGSGKHFGGFRGLDGPNSLVVGGWWNPGRMVMMVITIPWKSKTKQGMVFSMIHVKDSLLPRDKVWSLDFLGMLLSHDLWLI